MGKAQSLNGRKRIKFLPFAVAREFTRRLGLKNRKAWTEYCKSGNKPNDIPSNPDRPYEVEWAGYGDWLGTGRVANSDRTFRTFQEAREFARSLSLRNQPEWVKFCHSGQKPIDIPADPRTVYAEEWVSFGDWLGTGNLVGRKRSFDYVKSLLESFGYQVHQADGGMKSRIDCTCPNGHRTLIRPASLLQIKRQRSNGNGCPLCGHFLAAQTKQTQTGLSKERVLWDLQSKIIPANGGRFPKSNDLTIDVGYHLPSAIRRYGGYAHFCDLLGCEIRKKPAGYWDSWGNVEKEISNRFNLSGQVFPSHEHFISARIPVSHILKKYGLSLSELADKFGCKLASTYKCRDGHFVDSLFECVVDEYLYSRGIDHIVHPTIDGRFYADFGVGDLFVEVWGYSSKDKGKIGAFYNKRRKEKEAVYRKLQKQLLSIEHTFFKKLFNSFQKVENGLDALFSAEGFEVARKRNFTVEIVANSGRVWDEAAVVKMIESISSEVGGFPTYYQLQECGLYTVVNKFGGIRYFRKKMAPNLEQELR